MGTLHDTDRGGFIFAPEIGLHETVHELDFSSLYPNIICTRNVSPDVIRCDCHSDREDLEALATTITERVEIRLEHEAYYDWVAFVLQRESNAGALTKYFGKVVWRRRLLDQRHRSPASLDPAVHRGCLAGLSRPAQYHAVTGRGDRLSPERYQSAPRWNGAD